MNVDFVIEYPRHLYNKHIIQYNTSCPKAGYELYVYQSEQSLHKDIRYDYCTYDGILLEHPEGHKV